jgi:signal transduction histidine kinase
VVERPLVSQVAGWLALLAIYAGIAFGITRFRLFYVNTAQLLVWALSGLLVIALAAIALTLLAWKPATSMFMALAVSGWLYTPLRNFIWSRFGGLSGGMRYELLLTRILQRAARVEDAGQIERSWRATLHDAFQPGSLTVSGEAPEDVTIRDDGGTLLVPALPGGTPLRLEGAHGARGVFTPMDAQFADSLWSLFAHIKIYRAGFARGQQEERKRLAEELRQHIEQPLEQLAARTEDLELGRLLASALDELHVVLRTMATPRRPLAELAQQWHAELAERCAATGMQLHVDIAVSPQAPKLSARTALNLRRVLRESLTNAIRHAGATRVDASMAWDGEQERFFVSLCDDGTGFDPAAARRGRGLFSMETRAREMDGELHLRAGDQGGTCVCLSVPLHAEST